MKTTGTSSKTPRAPRYTMPRVVGWREHIGLPDLGLTNLAAKVDTGARTSALHAVNQRVVEEGGKRFVEFAVPVANRRSDRIVRAPLVDEREIKNTGGVPETRLVVRTTLQLGRHHWLIEVSLADRAKMEFDLILGRTAIRRHGILVDPGRSYLLGTPPEPVVRPRTKAKPAPVRTNAGRTE